MNKWIKKIKKGLAIYGFDSLNFIYPKEDFVVLIGGSRNVFKVVGSGDNCANVPKVEDNALAMGNYIAEHKNLPVYLLIPKGFEKYASIFLHPKIKTVERGTWRATQLMLRSKYLFFTHSGYFNNSSRRQKLINLWHGISNKRIGKAAGGIRGVASDITIGTSKASQAFFCDSFGISANQIYNTGYPRNDWMLKANTQKDKIKLSQLSSLSSFDKILIWMPTFREKDKDPDKINTAAEDVFAVNNFNLDSFQELLKQNNAMCLVKPHHMVKNYIKSEEYENVLFIDDFWIYGQKLSLYQLLGCTDALITDYSSVMIDYSLLDLPVFCIADDLEEYKENPGFYYDDFENRIPTKLLRSQEELHRQISLFLRTNEDAYKEERYRIRDFYFDYKDAYSAQRIADIVFS